MFCSQPFTMLDVYHDGSVYTCCADLINFYSIGNIYESSFEEIWNGEKAIALREKMLNFDFSLCNELCHRRFIEYPSSVKCEKIMSKYPEEISVSTDNSCNVACKICRDKILTTKYNEKEVKREIEEKWLPMFKDAKIVRFGCTGEPFFSKKELLLIKEIAKKYPDVKYRFHTNGIIADEKFLKKIGVYDRIHSFTVSIHSATEKTYKSIVKGGNYKRLQNNLKLYSKMKKEGLLEDFRMVFVVIAENYKEIPLFAQWAKDLGANVDFWTYRSNATEFGKNSLNFDMTNPEHPEYENLSEVLTNPILDESYVRLYPELQSLRNK